MSKIIQVEIGENGGSVRLDGRIKFFELSRKTDCHASSFLAEMLQFIGQNILDPSEIKDKETPCNELEITVYAFFRAKPPTLDPHPLVTPPDDPDFLEVI